jgi:hypothetical protein
MAIIAAANIISQGRDKVGVATASTTTKLPMAGVVDKTPFSS